MDFEAEGTKILYKMLCSCPRFSHGYGCLHSNRFTPDAEMSDIKVALIVMALMFIKEDLIQRSSFCLTLLTFKQNVTDHTTRWLQVVNEESEKVN